jgi:hypothetical protein
LKSSQDRYAVRIALNFTMSIPAPSSSLVASSAATAAATSIELHHDAGLGRDAPLHPTVGPAGEGPAAQAPDGNQMLAMASHFDDPWNGDAADARQRSVLSLLGYG